MSLTGRVGSAESCRTAASHLANALRSNGSGVRRVASMRSRASAGVRQVVSSRRKPAALAMPATSPRPVLEECRWEPENGPATDRGGDDPHAVRLTLGLVDDRPVVRADEEASFGN